MSSSYLTRSELQTRHLLEELGATAEDLKDPVLVRDINLTLAATALPVAKHEPRPTRTPYSGPSKKTLAKRAARRAK